MRSSIHKILFKHCEPPKSGHCQSKLYPVNSVPDVSCGVCFRSKENKVWREQFGHWLPNPAYIKEFRFHSGNNLSWMDPVQNVSAEQSFSATPTPVSRNRISWEGLGRILNLLKFEKEEIVRRWEVSLAVGCCTDECLGWCWTQRLFWCALGVMWDET